MSLVAFFFRLYPRSRVYTLIAVARVETIEPKEGITMATARQERWVMVRLLRETREALRQWVQMQDGNFLRGVGKPLRGQEDGQASVDAAVAELLRRDASHPDRANRANAKRKLKKTSIDESLSGWSQSSELPQG